MGKWHKNHYSMSILYSDGCLRIYQLPVSGPYITLCDYWHRFTTLSLFNLYAAVSWSSGRDTMRLLRDFKNGFFRASHNRSSRRRKVREPRQKKHESGTNVRFWGRYLARIIVVVIEKIYPKERKECVVWNLPVELLSYRYLGKCQLDLGSL